MAAGLTLSATITNTVANTATWTAYDPATTDSATANAMATVNALPPLVLSKTVGLDPNACAPTDSLALTAPADVTYCYEITNTTLVYTYATHDLFDTRLGPILSGLAYDLAPGATVFVTATANITETTVNEGFWSASGPNGFAFTQDRALVSLVPSISLTKTVGLDPGVCASTDTINANSGMPVYYCYEVANTGLFTLPLHDLVDTELGSILSGFAYDLAPGASVDTVAAGLTLSATVDHTTVNTATWTACVRPGHCLGPDG